MEIGKLYRAKQSYWLYGHPSNVPAGIMVERSDLVMVVSEIVEVNQNGVVIVVGDDDSSTADKLHRIVLLCNSRVGEFWYWSKAGDLQAEPRFEIYFEEAQ